MADDTNETLPEVAPPPKTHGKLIMQVNMKCWHELEHQEASIDIQLANWHRTLEGGADPSGLAMMHLMTQRFIQLDKDKRFFPALEIRWARFLRLDG